MKNILDSEDLEQDKPEKSPFSTLSLLFAILTLSLTIYLGRIFFFHFKVGEGFYDIFFWPLNILRLSSMLGFILAVISLVRQEPSRYRKAIGAGLNFLLFTFLLGSIVFANVGLILR